MLKFNFASHFHEHFSCILIKKTIIYYHLLGPITFLLSQHVLMVVQVIRLSAATQEYPESIICNVHGVNPKFLEIGKQKIEQQQSGNQAFTKGAYYIGKMVWSKGYRELLTHLRKHQKELDGLEVDLYGSGEDSNEVQETAKRLKIVVRVHPGRDHADPIFHE